MTNGGATNSPALLCTCSVGFLPLRDGATGTKKEEKLEVKYANCYLYALEKSFSL